MRCFQTMKTSLPLEFTLISDRAVHSPTHRHSMDNASSIDADSAEHEHDIDRKYILALYELCI